MFFPPPTPDSTPSGNFEARHQNHLSFGSVRKIQNTEETSPAECPPPTAALNLPLVPPQFLLPRQRQYCRRSHHPGHQGRQDRSNRRLRQYCTQKSKVDIMPLRSSGVSAYTMRGTVQMPMIKANASSHYKVVFGAMWDTTKGRRPCGDQGKSSHMRTAVQQVWKEGKPSTNN